MRLFKPCFHHLAFVLPLLLLAAPGTIRCQPNTFPASGYVGIGTTTPRQALEIKGGLTVNGPRSGQWSAGVIHLGDDLDWYRYIFAVRGTLDSPTGRFALIYHAATTDRYWEGLSIEPQSLGSDLFDVNLNRGNLVIRSDSNVVARAKVGINRSTTPYAPLVVGDGSGGSAPTIVLPDATSSRYSVGIGSRSIPGIGQALDIYAGDAGANEQNLTGAARRMTITAAGKVGIGTSTPTDTLSVNGTVRAKEVVVETSGWADDVFASDYQLASLQETEKHIQSHGHLPNVPSAAEVAQNGISLAAMQITLLRKLEEMTLHQIALHKEVEALRTANLELQRINQAMLVRLDALDDEGRSQIQSPQKVKHTSE